MIPQEYFVIVGATLTLIAVASFIVLTISEIWETISDYKKRKSNKAQLVILYIINNCVVNLC